MQVESLHRKVSLSSVPPLSLSLLHYMVVFPAVIHPSQEEKLCIHLSSLTEAVHLAVTLEMETKNHTLVEQDVEKPGTFECITFQVSSEEVVFLHVLIHSDDSVLFEGRKKVLVKPQKNVILVETDKALYKPGETVKFRIVNLDNDLKVIKNEVSFTPCIYRRRSLSMIHIERLLKETFPSPCMPVKS
uniref:Macroglobulin domain-containing protein n=1 Tax=Anas platyrhynchos platyrhynchos TaxID=8840 RepID=A0A493U0F0_ANAPP